MDSVVYEVHSVLSGESTGKSIDKTKKNLRKKSSGHVNFLDAATDQRIFEPGSVGQARDLRISYSTK